MATDEALKVLNLTKAELQDTVKIQQVCEELMTCREMYHDT